MITGELEYLYGKGDNYNEKNSHVLPALIYKFNFAKQNNLKFVKCWGSGKPLREFLYVDDLADACIFALNNGRTISYCYISDIGKWNITATLRDNR